jgi:hypothetical protein
MNCPGKGCGAVKCCLGERCGESEISEKRECGNELSRKREWGSEFSGRKGGK